MNFDISLYLVTDSTYHSEESFLHTVDEACKVGVTFVQLREKNKGGKDYLELAIKVKGITDKYNIPLVIDDRIDIAMAIDAAGVHVGSSDIPVSYARKILGKGKIVGATAKTVETAIKAYKDGADYLGTGAIYPTTTKVVTVLTEVSVLAEVCKAVPIPVVAIGGLNKDNIGILADAPIDGIAVVSAIMKAENPSEATKDLIKTVKSTIKSIKFGEVD